MHLRLVLASKGQSEFKGGRQTVMVCQHAESNLGNGSCFLHAEEPSAPGDAI